MTISTRARAIWLGTISIISFFGSLAVLAWDETGRIDRDVLLVGAFFFSAPVLCLSGLLLVGAVVASRGSSWLYLPGERFMPRLAGQCAKCQAGYTAEDTHCPGCGRSLSSRWVAPRMMSPNAREREQNETERVRLDLRLRRHPKAVAAARSLVELSKPSGERDDVIEKCLTDGRLVQQLYRSAARHLHPDHNRGEHMEHWYELRNSVKTLQSFHDLVETA